VDESVSDVTLVGFWGDILEYGHAPKKGEFSPGYFGETPSSTSPLSESGFGIEREDGDDHGDRITEGSTAGGSSSSSNSSSPEDERRPLKTAARMDANVVNALMLLVPDFLKQLLPGPQPEMLHSIHQNAMFLARFWNEPLAAVLELLRTDRPQGMVHFCSLLSISYRVNQNVAIADALLEYDPP